jgi:hypothetical protein
MNTGIKRSYFIPGQILSYRDLMVDQAYHIAKLRALNQGQRTTGALYGLTLAKVDEPSGRTISIQPGMAIDGSGREILLLQVYSQTISAPSTGTVTMTVAIAYNETIKTVCANDPSRVHAYVEEIPLFYINADPPSDQERFITLGQINFKNGQIDSIHAVNTLAMTLSVSEIDFISKDNQGSVVSSSMRIDRLQDSLEIDGNLAVYPPIPLTAPVTGATNIFSVYIAVTDQQQGVNAVAAFMVKPNGDTSVMNNLSVGEDLALTGKLVFAADSSANSLISFAQKQLNINSPTIVLQGEVLAGSPPQPLIQSGYWKQDATGKPLYYAGGVVEIRGTNSDLISFDPDNSSTFSGDLLVNGTLTTATLTSPSTLAITSPVALTGTMTISASGGKLSSNTLMSIKGNTEIDGNLLLLPSSSLTIGTLAVALGNADQLSIGGAILTNADANGVSLYGKNGLSLRDTGTKSASFIDLAAGSADHGTFAIRSSNAFTSRLAVNTQGIVEIGSDPGSNDQLNELLRVWGDGYIQGNLSVGNGVDNQYHKLVIRGPNNPTNANSFQDISYEFMNAGSAKIRAYRGGTWDTYLQFLTNGVAPEGDNPLVRMQINSDGSVVIGTDPGSAALLRVGGDIVCQGNLAAQNLKLPALGADYVFDDAYALPTLHQVEQFIKINRHLPEIPSAQTMQKNGIDISSVITKQLVKIEELTLYAIEANYRIATLEKERDAANDQMNDFQQRLARIEYLFRNQ